MSTVYWLTGLSGAGKTTIGRELYTLLKNKESNVIYLDGDILREVFGVTDSYSSEERFKLAMQYSRLCKLLHDQETDVVCATISLFRECWNWNRKNMTGYKEIYIKVPMEILIERDQKGIYSRALKGDLDHVMGIDIPFSEPDCPDLIIENPGDKSPAELARILYETFHRGKT